MKHNTSVKLFPTVVPQTPRAAATGNVFKTKITYQVNKMKKEKAEKTIKFDLQQIQRCCPAHSTQILAIQFAEDTIYSGSMDYSLKIWKRNQDQLFELTQTYSYDSAVTHVFRDIVVCASGKIYCRQNKFLFDVKCRSIFAELVDDYLIIITMQNVIYVFEMQNEMETPVGEVSVMLTSEQKYKFKFEVTEPIVSAVFIPDYYQLLIATKTTITQFDIESSRELLTLTPNHGNGVSSIVAAVVNDRWTLFTGSPDESVEIYQIENNIPTMVSRIFTGEKVIKLIVSADYLMVCQHNGVKLYDHNNYITSRGILKNFEQKFISSACQFADYVIAGDIVGNLAVFKIIESDLKE